MSIGSTLVLKKFQTVLLIKVPAPELLIIFSIRETPVYGRRRPVVGYGLRRTNHCIIGRAEEGGDRHPGLSDIDNGSMPYAFVFAIT